MEISKDALLRITRAARASLKMANAMQALMAEGNFRTIADDIADNLLDGLLLLSGEQDDVGKVLSPDESTTRRLLTDNLMTDDGIVGWLFMMNSIRKKHLAPKEELPKPQTMSKEDMRSLYQKNGGYMTPEGDWK